jgi:hypothetical protein
MDDMTKSQKMLDRVVKLLAQAERTTHEAEAETFYAKAQELMAAYSISEATLRHAQGRAQPDEIVSHRVHFTGLFKTSLVQVASAVGAGSDFRSIMYDERWRLKHEGKNAVALEWIGFRSEIEAAEMLLASLLISCSRGMEEHLRRYRQECPWSGKQQWYVERRGYIFGFADGVRSTLTKARKDAEATAQRERAAASEGDSVADPATPSVALVLAERKRQIDDWVDEKYGRLSKGRSRSVGSIGSGYSNGRTAGAAAAGAGRRQGVSGSHGSLGSGG